MRLDRRQAQGRRWRWIVGGLVALALLPALYLWWLLLSPRGYSPPAGFEWEPLSGEQYVFVYGTLRNPLVRWLVLGRPVTAEEAFLPDFNKQGLDITPAPGAGVHGELLILEPPGLRRLDRYERLGIRYERIPMTLEDGRQAWVYRRLQQEASPQ
ncbi:MAG: gamma-glutamylcyclotransferase family protein [Haliea sp.]